MITLGVTVVITTLNVVVVFLFLRRSRARVAVTPGEVIVCLSSVPLSAAALQLAPTPDAWPVVAGALFVTFGAGAIASLVALDRSFGVLPAVRPLVRHGPFALVRHPLYTCELGMVAACTLASEALLASALVLGSAVALVMARIRIEERVLSLGSAYAPYKSTVRWRMLPHVW